MIPPSIGMIIYGVISETSIAELFIAGIGPGLMILTFFSLYCLYYATVNKVPTEPKASWSERLTATRKALWPLMFPLIIVGGIYGGIFSPTEAAAVCVLYAMILEFGIFRSLSRKDVFIIARSTGLITAVVFYSCRRRQWIFLDYLVCPNSANDSRSCRDQRDGPNGGIGVNLYRLFRCLYVC